MHPSTICTCMLGTPKKKYPLIFQTPEAPIYAHMGCSRNVGLLLVIDDITAPNIWGYQNGTLILGTTHISPIIPFRWIPNCRIVGECPICLKPSSFSPGLNLTASDSKERGPYDSGV